MSIQLKNEFIEVLINKSGAELTSIKRVGDDINYVWSGDPAYWKRHAPVLFPIVGKVVNDEYRVKGKTYHLGQHGFARDMDFDIVNLSDNDVTLSLEWSSESLDLYPYKFELFVRYTLVENKVVVGYEIKNLDEQIIYFSIGAHPAFNCPMEEDEKFDDYYFEFEVHETAEITPLDSNGLLCRRKEPYLNNKNIIEIDNKLFKGDALIFDHLKSSKVTLKSHKSKRSVQVDFKEFPFLGLWSIPSGAPFICIEPWVGHADYSDYKGEFADKEDGISLDVLSSYSCSFGITVE